ncbi:hypothetical protein [Caballeronia mineralivorans]|jgi:hypothetical protein|uniref:hypothetical protein n=1 Tax=Caballeronia mineralivorans TaxID=2010198 RepID=UPI0023EF6731|nr:hypothetical protein [Caballeronia mineralivorans]MDB5786735.1 hypothetical protein [Caballeronia mineralivorans]
MNCATQRREQHTERLKALALARERGGRLISPVYADAATPLHWECAFGHTRDASPDEVTRRGCGQCTRRGVYDPAHALKTLP